MKENAELHQNNQRNLAIINDFMEQNRVLKQKKQLGRGLKVNGKKKAGRKRETRSICETEIGIR